MSVPRKDFVGKKFNYLTIIEELPRRRDTNGYVTYRMVKAKCDCGKVITIKLNSLINGRQTKSCGCIRKEMNKGKTKFVPGFDYKSWEDHQKQRKLKWVEQNKDRVIQNRKKYYKLNRDKLISRSSKRYNHNRDKIIEQVKAYRFKNNDKVSAYKKSYSISHKKENRERASNWSKKNPEKRKAAAKIARRDLKTWYIKDRLKRVDGLSNNIIEMHPILIEMKRIEMRTKRLTKNEIHI